MAMSNYLRNALINEVLRGTDYTPPTDAYLALYTSNPTVDNTGTEVSGGSYARKNIVLTSPVAGYTQNTSDITFDLATANWGTITHAGVLDAITGGNLLMYVALPIPKVVATDNQFICKAGQLTDTWV